MEIKKEFALSQVMNSGNILREIFSLFDGNELIHKIALLNKRIRYDILPKRGHLERQRVFRIKLKGSVKKLFPGAYDQADHFDLLRLSYMLKICPNVKIEVTQDNQEIVGQAIRAIDFYNGTVMRFSDESDQLTSLQLKFIRCDYRDLFDLADDLENT
jgi:hypothetical protein